MEENSGAYRGLDSRSGVLRVSENEEVWNEEWNEEIKFEWRRLKVLKI